MNQDLLDSWKEIAAYLGRGVRTVQRWENNLHLPVRRAPGKPHSSIVAFKSELDHWLHNAHTISGRPQPGARGNALLLPLLKSDVRTLSQNLGRVEHSSATHYEIIRKARSPRLAQASLRYARSATRHLGTMKQSRQLLAHSIDLCATTRASLQRARRLLEFRDEVRNGLKSDIRRSRQLRAQPYPDLSSSGRREV